MSSQPERRTYTPSVTRETLTHPASHRQVTYRSLSRELRMHVNTAKNELAVYHDNAPYQSQPSCATYLLCGEVDPSYADDVEMDYGEGEDPEGDWEDDGDEVPQATMLDLQEAGHICTPTEQIRAADRGKDAKELVKIVGKIVSPNIKIVHSEPSFGRSKRQPMAGPSKLKKEPSVTVEPPKEQSKIDVDKKEKGKEKEKPKASGKLDFSRAKPKEKKPEPAEAAKVKKEKEAVEKKGREEKEKEKEKAKEREKAKQKEKEEKAEQKEREKEREQSAPIKTTTKKTLEPTKRGTKRKSVLDVSDSDSDARPSKVPSRRPSPALPQKKEKPKESVRVKGRALISDDEDEEVVKPTRKARKAAVDSDNEDVLAMMDIDDEQVTRVSRVSRAPSRADDDDDEEEDDIEMEEKAPEADEDVDMLDDTVSKPKPKKRAPKKVVPVGSNGLKKRRVVKSRSTTDAKGYMVFEDYSEYESVEEEEPAPEPKGKAKAKAKAKPKEEEESGGDEPAPAAKPKLAVKKAAVKGKTGAGSKGGKQGGIAGFFTAKAKKDHYHQLREEEELEVEDKNTPTPTPAPEPTTHTEEYEMVQTYGVARASTNNALEPPSADDASEGSALLGGSGDTAKRTMTKRDGHASIMSCISNLANTIMGTGDGVGGPDTGGTDVRVLGVRGGLWAVPPLRVRDVHPAPALLVLRGRAAHIPARSGVLRHGDSGQVLWGVYQGLMPNVVQSFYHVLTPPETLPPPWMLNGANWISIFMIVLVPLAFLRRLDSLRHTSYIALFAVAYLVAIVIGCYYWPMKGMPARGEVHFIKFTPKFVSTFPIQVFAFTCAQNVGRFRVSSRRDLMVLTAVIVMQLFPLYNEVKANTQARMNIVIGGSIGSAIVTYEIIAVLGYLTFGSKVGANIVAMYPSTSLFIAVGQLAIVILVLFSYPLQVHPCRNCLDKVLHSGGAVVKAVGDAEGDAAEGGDDDHGETDMSGLKHTLLTSAIIAGGFTVAYLVDDLRMGEWYTISLISADSGGCDVVLAFVGSTGSTTISFILPGLFYWKVGLVFDGVWRGADVE
ncbi:hypothetical protein DXG01_013735 [Tephrocybe rancida]|nr:hypothetical protein DXG01_013735 [Tephrocybe rancida]